MYHYKRPARPSKPKTPKLLYIALTVVLLISAGFIISYLHSDYMFRHGEGHSAAYMPAPEPERYFPMPPPPTPAPVVAVETPAPASPTSEPTPEPGPTPPPRVQRQEFLDWRTHYGNNDIVGHLYVPNTTINYLVTQTTDNFFYLSHDIRGRRSAAGWIYLCAFADLYGQDQNLVIFGHNMRANHMFHAVRRFLDRDFFYSNRYIYFSTIYADYVFEVFSVYITHISWPYIYPNYNHLEGGWDFFINAFAERSLFDAGIQVSGDDRILTLSTCENARAAYRIAVHARLISETFPHLDDDTGLDSDVYYNGVRG